MKFASKVWKLLVAVKDAMVMLLLLLFFGMLYLALAVRPAPSRVENGALLLTLDGTIVEEKSKADPLAVLMATGGSVHEYQARDIQRALTLAATDSRIKAVVLDLSRFAGGRQVHLRDIGTALESVRKAGKPVLAFANAYADSGVQIASHASEVWVDPMGGAFVTGPGVSAQYFKGLLDRFNVSAHVYRVGTHKSAVEPYMRSDMSPEAKEEYQTLLNERWALYRADLAKARPKARLDAMLADPVAWVKASGGDTAEAAKAVGLVDRIGDKTDFEKRIKDIVGKSAIMRDDKAPQYAHTGLKAWLAANPIKTEGAPIAVITIAGSIEDGMAGPGTAGGDRIAQLLDRNRDKKFKGLVVRIDSPGGSVMASERIRRAIIRWRDEKIPVVVSMGNSAASGGYWVATPAQRIFADPATLTGSIGVFSVVPTFEKVLADYGVKTDGVRTTALSGQPDVFGGLTPEVEGMLQGSVEGIYTKFLGVVAKSRNKTPEQVDTMAQGRVWTGGQGQRLGLVDQMGGLDAALAYTAKVGGVGNGKWHAQHLQDTPDSVSMLVDSFTSDAEESALFQGDAGVGYAGQDYAGFIALQQEKQMRQAFAQFTQLMKTKGVQAYCLECSDVPNQTAKPSVHEQSSFWLMMTKFIGLH